MFIRHTFSKDIIDKLKIFFHGKKKLNLYFDFKNAIFRPYKPSDVLNLNIKEEISNILTSMLSKIAELNAILKQDFEIEYFIYGENGKSGYHYELYHDYKKRRHTDALNRPELKNINNILHFSAAIGANIFNFIPKVTFLYSKYLEVDAIPYYIIRENSSNEIGHFIMSDDNDNLQILESFKNVLIYDKGVKRSKTFKGDYALLNHDNYIHRFLKKPDLIEKYSHYFKNKRMLTLIRAIIGDTSDSIEGVPGIGPVGGCKIMKMFSSNIIIKPIGEIIRELSLKPHEYTMFKSDADVSKLTPAEKKLLSKIMENEDIIQRNLKLMDYEIFYNSQKTNIKTRLEEFQSFQKISNPFKLAEHLKESNAFFEEDLHSIGKRIDSLIL